ncbi:transmembrane protein 192 isoform X2 [Hippopotamus amphibius kiboko]|uniref:transmembrane protein 192 isoform X1 n=1 Tax=Hippopotamus amphibius kiboko TaxID=575201 RepID=UPI00259736F5|nr:transmembrane protein 192 isoform X1 [Hippopotamus amphibius kiboko]XP_057584208.1 transmembrane protein 192 isoform X2 [Hippopotamus amphibius kiboko]
MGSLDFVQSIEDDPLLDTQHLAHHSLQAHFRPRFHPLPTVIIASLLLLIHVVFVILAFLTGVLCSYPNPIEDKCPGNYTNPLKVQTVIILGKVILWILHFLLERYIQYHHSKVRNRGYNKIYRSTRHLKSLALMIHSTGSTALLLLLCLQHSFPEPSTLYLDLILATLALELVCSLTCLLVYTVEHLQKNNNKPPPARADKDDSERWMFLYHQAMVKIRKFNKAKPQPDVLEEEKLYAYPINITSETGFRTLSSLEDVVEKQGDIIVYLRRHNALLSRRLLAFASSDLSSQPSGV